MGWGADDADSIDSGTDPASAAQSTADSYGGGGGNDDNGNDRQTYTSPTTGNINTRNFNVDRSQPSVQTESGRVYGTQSQLDAMFGPSPTNDTVGGMGYSFGGGRTTMAQMAGYAGKMSPTTVGGYGISAGYGSVGIGQQAGAFGRGVGTPNAQTGWSGGTLSTGYGLSKPTVVDIDMMTGKITSVRPGTVGLMEGQRATERSGMTTEQTVTMATAMGFGYAGQMTDPAMSGITVGGPLGLDPTKSSFVGYQTKTGTDFGRVTGEGRVAEMGIAQTGLAGMAMFGANPDIATINSLSTGQQGTYSDMGGIVGALEGGPTVSFGSPGPTQTGDGDSPYVNVAQYRSRVGAPAPRFRSRQVMSPIRSMRFPSAPRPSFSSARAYAAEGGYVSNPDYVQKGLEERKPGFHAMQFGGKVYAVAPSESNPREFMAYGGTMEEVKAAFGGAFGYDPSTIDFTKRPGEVGFGTDLKGFVPGMGGLNSQNQFVNANGLITQNTADPFLDKYRKQMMVGGPAGFVGARPEQLDEQKTIADDVPMDVPEGTFVLNAAAVEFMGSADVEKMLKDASEKAAAMGVDISAGAGKMSEEGAVPLAVSAGEVIVPPVLAKIIGYDRLEKINNRGKREVARRAQENQATESPEEQQMAQLQSSAVS